MQHVIDAFHNRPLVKVKDRNFMINPITDHQPAMEFALIKETIDELSKLTDMSKVEKILGEEDRGGYIAALMAYEHKLPFSLVKWNPTGVEGQISVDFRNAYTEGRMYLTGVEKGEKVIIVEDMIDSGGTIIALINLMLKAELEIMDVIAISEKFEFQGAKRIKDETGFDVKHLVKFTSEGDKSKVVWVNGKGSVKID